MSETFSKHDTAIQCNILIIITNYFKIIKEYIIKNDKKIFIIYLLLKFLNIYFKLLLFF